jgi:hypothetical protein
MVSINRSLQQFQLVQQCANKLTWNIIHASHRVWEDGGQPSVLYTPGLVNGLCEDPIATSYFSRAEDHWPLREDKAPIPHLHSWCPLCFPLVEDCLQLLQEGKEL